MKQYMSGLNEDQLLAVDHENGPCMVLAGPGSGKTTVITSRICYLIDKGITPSEILVVTFSKAAANEMKNRFIKLNDKKVNQVNFGTFHSIFFKALKEYKNYKLENLIDENQKFNVVKAIIRKMNLTVGDEEDQIKDIINSMGYFMSALTDINEFEQSVCKPEHFKQIVSEYQSFKEKQNKFDYDDMLTDCYYLLKSNERVLNAIRKKYPYILVDEFQDVNPVQFETIKLMAEPLNNLFVVGDDDQSIYSFRGATPDILIDFERFYPKCQKVLLKQNYRSTKNLLNAALAVINKNKNRYPKDLSAPQDSGQVPKLIRTEDFESEGKAIAEKIQHFYKQGIPYGNMAVIFRTNLQSRALIDAFMDLNIPFNALDGAASLYNHWIFKDIAAYLALTIKSDDKRELLRIINKPKRYISRVALEKADSHEGDFLYALISFTGLNNLQINAINELQNNIKHMKRMAPEKIVKYIRNVIGYDEYLRGYALDKGIDVKGLLETIEEVESATMHFDTVEQYLNHVKDIENRLKEEYQAPKGEDRVELLTMHRAKGLEFEVVMVCGVVEGLTPYQKDEIMTDKVLEEERRLFYVAMTRAKKELYISAPDHRFKKSVKPSRFISEMATQSIVYEKLAEVGKRVYHRIYGEGVITEVFDKKGEARLKIDFNGILKELNLKVCLQNDILKIIR